MAQLDLSNMILNDINVEAITNTGKTGVFDRLMASVNENIEIQYQDNRITGTDYANVYLGSLQSVLSQSIQFVLQEQLSEAQISGILKDNDIKDEQLNIAVIDKAVKQFELDNLLPEQLLKIKEEVDLLYTDRVLKDKQSAKLGLDNVMKQSEESRSDTAFVYTPKYTKGQ